MMPDGNIYLGIPQADMSIPSVCLGNACRMKNTPLLKRGGGDCADTRNRYRLIFICLVETLLLTLRIPIRWMIRHPHLRIGGELDVTIGENVISSV
jgi:hypothetical protein